MNNLAIFASGTGSNAIAIIRHFRAHPQCGEVRLVVTNRASAQVVRSAEELSVEVLCFDNLVFRESAHLVVGELQSRDIDFIALAGFMLLIPPQIINSYGGRIINIHPSLLPEFGGKGMYGMRVHQAVIDSGQTRTGITIHWVDQHYDQGAIIFQKELEVMATDTPESLCQRIQELEHHHYPRIIQQILNKQK